MASRSYACLRRALLLAAALGSLAATGAGPAAAATPTRAAARLLAAKINLQTADVPGFRATKAHRTTPSDRRLTSNLARCAGAAAPGSSLVDIDSSDFSSAGPGAVDEQQVSSNVTVEPSPRLAAQNLAAIRSAKGRACATAAFDRLLRAMKLPRGVSFGPVSTLLSRPAAPGAGGSFLLRFKIIAAVSGLKVPFYFDLLGFTVGPVEVGLSALGFGAPFPAGDEQRLFTLLLGRATANPL